MAIQLASPIKIRLHIAGQLQVYVLVLGKGREAGFEVPRWAHSNRGQLMKGFGDRLVSTAVMSDI